MNRWMLGFTVAALASLIPLHAHAGEQFPEYFNCNELCIYTKPNPLLPPVCSTVTGYTCVGTMLGARDSSGTTDEAYFSLDSSGNSDFYAMSGSRSYACTASTAALKAVWPTLVSSRGYWGIQMDLNGNCTSAYEQNASLYSWQ